jgi:hypothetical protein
MRTAAPTAVAGADLACANKPCCQSKIAASPKVRQTLAEQPNKCCGNAATELSTTSPPDDGIVASPKVRQQLNERPAKIEIAPLK